MEREREGNGEGEGMGKEEGREGNGEGRGRGGRGERFCQTTLFFSDFGTKPETYSCGLYCHCVVPHSLARSSRD